MYYLEENKSFKSLERLACAAGEFLQDYLMAETDEGEEPNFPENFSPWEEQGDKFRLLHVPVASEAECGTDDGKAWAATIAAYANPNSYRTGKWESLV